MTTSQRPALAGQADADVLVVGGGPGGTPAAMDLARAGRRVLLAEAGAGLGGTCLFEGCIPSKIFRETARRLAAAGEADRFGITGTGDGTRVDWARVQARKEAILAGRATAALATADAIPGLSVAFGRIELTSPRAAVLTASDLPAVLDSDTLIGIRELPASLIVIGAGPVGTEMAQIFCRLGTRGRCWRWRAPSCRAWMRCWRPGWPASWAGMASPYAQGPG